MLEQQPTPVTVLPHTPDQDDVLSGEFFGDSGVNPLIRAHELRIKRDEGRRHFSGHVVASAGDTPKGNKRFF